MRKTIETVFLLPVIGKNIFVAQRNTPPFRGYWDRWGKIDELKGERTIFDQPQYSTPI